MSTRKKPGVLRWPENMMRRQWTRTDGDARCQKCGGRNPRWWVETRIWEQVMGSGKGILCVVCFMLRADEAGIGRTGAWQLYPSASLR